MFFALTDDQREFDAAVRGYLADRFDLAAVRAVVEDRRSGRRPPGHAVEGRRRAGLAGRAGARGARRPRPRAGRGPGHRPRARRRGGAGAVARHGAGRRGDPAGRLGRAARDLAAPARRRRRGGRGRAPRGRAPGTLPAVEYGAIADVLVAPSADGLALVEDGDRHPARQLRRHRPAGRRARPAPARRCPAPPPRWWPSWPTAAAVLVAADLVGIAREALPGRWPTTGSASSSGCRSGPSRRSSTRWPTCTWRSPWPSTPRSTPRTRWTPGSTTPRWPCRWPRPRPATPPWPRPPR